MRWTRAERWRPALAGSGVLAVVAGLLVAGMNGGYPATRPRLSSGAAWLASTQVGQVTLLDGSSGEVAAQVPVASRGDRIEVTQQGGTAYVVNHGTGAVRRVDGATFEVTRPTVPIPDARDGLVAVPGPGVVYVLDAARGVLARTDPVTLADRDTALPLVTRLDPRAVVVDDAGRLWVLDRDTGDLVWIDRGRRRTRPGISQPGAGLLVPAGGAPVVVDTGRRRVSVLDPGTGDTRATFGLPAGSADRAWAGGSSANRLWVIAGGGLLVLCDLDARGCGAALPLGTGTGELGTPVESGSRLFVPDYSTGQVLIVELDRPRVTARAQVLQPGTRFQLLNRDGLVFFNDPDSEHAGVVRVDGGVRPTAKYDPHGPPHGPGEGTHPAPTPTPTGPTPGGGSTPTGPTPTGPTPTAPAPNPGPGGDTDPQVQISVSRTSAQVGEDVTAKVIVVRGPALLGAEWSFGDGQTAAGPTTTHRWTAPQTYQLSVQATFPRGRTAAASLSIVVTAAPPVRPPVLRPAQGDFGTQHIGRTTAPMTFTVTNPNTVPATITTQVSGDVSFLITADSCAAGPLAPNATCQVKVAFTPPGVGDRAGRLTITDDGGRTVTADLVGTGFAILNLVVVNLDPTGAPAPPGVSYGVVTDNQGLVNCRTGTCPIRISHASLTLTAKANNCGTDPCLFKSWSGGRCSGTNPVCNLDLRDMRDDESLTATFEHLIG